MLVLHVKWERTGAVIGLIALSDDGMVSTDTDTADGIFSQYRKYFASDAETFHALATGWSNGYVTIAALVPA